MHCTSALLLTKFQQLGVCVFQQGVQVGHGRRVAVLESNQKAFLHSPVLRGALPQHHQAACCCLPCCQVLIYRHKELVQGQCILQQRL